ncbi:MAG: LLM class flavin-dependent oxidoreductase [Planctomycetes bacterium]|nr:LLM class flavin-dependent oxidoreductase [Planctomycetota bacterium]
MSMQFSLYYFANQDAADDRNKYRLILESAEWADRNGFVRLWTPERHFHSFGGLSPNPSILCAALAARTRRVQLCAGSVVLPLHDPIRVAEEWAMVDNLSNGRVGIGVACGWVPNDFVIGGSQEKFDRRKEVFADGITTLRRLWRGEGHRLVNPQGKEVEIHTLPRPVQADVPIWITVAGNPDTFRQAGQLGAHVLTHLLGQTLDGLADKIQAYRDAWRAAGHAGDGTVTLMLHTFVGERDDEVHDLVRGPMKRYLHGSLTLAAAHICSVPFLQNAENIDLSQATPEFVDEVLDASFEKYFHMSGMFGSLEKCLDMVDRVEATGVDEVACLIDYGVDADAVLAALENLNVVRILANPKSKVAVR